MVFQNVLESSMQPAPVLESGEISRHPRSKKRVVLVLVLISFLAFALVAGRLLVRDGPEKADVIVVLAGDSQDLRYTRGMELLRAGYGRRLFLDASSGTHYFGRTPAEYAKTYLEQDAGVLSPQVSVCPFQEDSTVTETLYVAKCLEPLHAKNVLLVTSDWHTARARSIFMRRLPQYHWSTAAARDPQVFGTQWWRHREWAKTTFQEWLKVIWWNAVDRWR